MSNNVVNSYRYVASDYPDGLGDTADCIVEWTTTRTPNKVAVQIASNLPANSWHWNGDYKPIITSGFTASIGTKFSFSAWVKPDELNEWYPMVASKGASEATEEFSSYWSGYGSGGAFGGECLGDKSLRTTGTTPALDSDNHVVYTIDGDAGEYYVWVNGTQHSTDTGTESSTGSTDPLKVGTNWTSVGYDRYFYGNMQQLLYYDRVLTDAEVGLLYGSGSGIAMPATETTLQNGLKIYFDFQDVTGVAGSGVQTLINRAIP